MKSATNNIYSPRVPYRETIIYVAGDNSGIVPVIYQIYLKGIRYLSVYSWLSPEAEIIIPWNKMLSYIYFRQHKFTVMF